MCNESGFQCGVKSCGYLLKEDKSYNEVMFLRLTNSSMSSWFCVHTVVLWLGVATLWTVLSNNLSSLYIDIESNIV